MNCARPIRHGFIFQAPYMFIMSSPEKNIAMPRHVKEAKTTRRIKREIRSKREREPVTSRPSRLRRESQCATLLFSAHSGGFSRVNPGVYRRNPELIHYG